MKNFKDLINEITVQWFQKITKEKFDEFTKSPQFDIFNNQVMNINKTDFIDEQNKVFMQIKELKSYADILGYVKLNKVSLENNWDMTKVQEMILKEGLKSLPSLMVKIQLGYISDLVEHFFNEIRMWQDRIGRETPLSEIDENDINYLISLSLATATKKLVSLVKDNPEVMSELGEEFEVLSTNKSSLDQKEKMFKIIKIYFTKQRNEVLNSLSAKMMDMDQLNINTSAITDSTQEIEKVNYAINEIGFILDYGTILLNNLKSE